MFYETLLKLCDQKGVKITNVVKELNMSSGNMTRWKSGILPHGKNLKKLADYFEVSVDYLLGKTDNPGPKAEDITFDDFTYAMHKESKALTAEQKEALLNMARLFKQSIEAEKGQKKSD